MTDPTVTILDQEKLGLDPYFVQDNLHRAAEAIATKVPPRYLGAVADHPEVRAWVHELVAGADVNQPYPSVITGPSLLLLGPVGTGKALADETPLATPDGPRPIGAMRVGDAVFGGDGQPCKVVGVYPQGLRDLWRVNLRDGRSVVCDEDHLWMVRKMDPRYPPKVLSLGEMLDDGIRLSNGAPRWYIPTPSAVEYPASSLPVDPYTLGALIGDGGLTSNTPTITSADPEVVAELQLPDGVDLRVRPRQRDSKALTWHLVGPGRPRPNPLTVQLRNLGLMGLLSCERFIPGDYLTASVQDRLDLLAGLVDTDGYVKGTSIAIATSSERLAHDLGTLVRSLGGFASSRRKETSRLPSWTVHLAIPLELGCPSRLPRKRDIWTPRRDGRGISVAITSVGRSLADSATCIAVDSPDSTYLTADYVRTHNTFQCYGAVRALAVSGVRCSWDLITAADLFARQRPRPRVDTEEEFERLTRVGLLILDDLGAAKASEWTEEVTYRLVNARYQTCKPTVVTSNVTPRHLAEALGERVTSRLRQMGRTVALTGTDRRGRAAS